MTCDFDVAVLDTLSLVEVELFNVASMHLSFDTYKPSAEASPGGASAATSAVEDNPLNYASFQNSFRACDDSLYLLGSEECRRARSVRGAGCPAPPLPLPRPAILGVHPVAARGCSACARTLPPAVMFGKALCGWPGAVVPAVVPCCRRCECGVWWWRSWAVWAECICGWWWCA
jgi:hypothetical protein